ncbi:MAG TPA: translation initiation factor IF-2 N-terminal domain-containing protein, partial [Nitrospirota bacterium]|nr:translation initiation factor IF-2 N-terminal domain-containing protein [Nitrospirota bacterium]
MTVIRVHELAKKMGVESKELVAVLEKMGIKGKTPTSGLDDKETKSLIEKLKAVRKEKEKEKTKKEKDTVDVIASKEERLKKAAALIGKFSSTLEKPGVKPKPAPIPPQLKPEMPAPPVIPPPGQAKQSPPA